VKIYTPSLILYFTACIVYVALTAAGLYDMSVYAKAVIIPAIFFYYMIKTKYRVDLVVILALIIAYIGDIYILMGFSDALEVSILCFGTVYLIMLIYVIKDFIRLRFKRLDVLVILVVAAMLAFLLQNVMSLEFGDYEKSIGLFAVYGIVLGVLSLFSAANYIADGCYAFLNLVLLMICFIVSDLFFAFNRFYLQLPVFESIAVTAQVLAYLFMSRYYIYRKADGLSRRFVIDLWAQGREKGQK
jgi:hypothetical protein